MITAGPKPHAAPLTSEELAALQHLANLPMPTLPTPVELAMIAAPLWAAESTPRGEIALKQAYALWQEAHRFLQEQRQKQQAHSHDHDE